MNTFLTTLAAVVPAMALFGVWITVLLKQYTMTMSSEIRRIEEKVNLGREMSSVDITNLTKMVDLRLSHIDSKLDVLHDQQEKWFHNRP